MYKQYAAGLIRYVQGLQHIVVEISFAEVIAIFLELVLSALNQSYDLPNVSENNLNSKISW